MRRPKRLRQKLANQANELAIFQRRFRQALDQQATNGEAASREIYRLKRLLEGKTEDGIRVRSDRCLGHLRDIWSVAAIFDMSGVERRLFVSGPQSWDYLASDLADKVRGAVVDHLTNKFGVQGHDR